MGQFYIGRAFRIEESGQPTDYPEGRTFCLHLSDISCIETIHPVTVNGTQLVTIMEDTDIRRKFYLKETIQQIYDYIDANSGGGGSGTQVNSDWTEASYSNPAYIKHKPTKLSAFTNDNGFIGEPFRVTADKKDAAVGNDPSTNEVFAVWLGDQVFRIMYENVDDGQGGTYRKLTEIGLGDIAGGGNNVFVSVDDNRNAITLNAGELNLWGKLLLNGLDILGLRYKIVSAATYSPTMEDKGMMLYFTSTSPITLTVPKDTLQSDFNCGIVQHGSALITVTAASGVTVTNADTLSKSKGKGSIFSLLGTPTKNTFYTVGQMQ